MPNHENKDYVATIISWFRGKKFVAIVIVAAIIIIGASQIIEALKTITPDEDTADEKVLVMDLNASKKIIKIFDSDSKSRDRALSIILKTLKPLESENVKVDDSPVKYSNLDLQTLFDENLRVLVIHWSTFKYDGFNNEDARDTLELVMQRIYKISPQTEFIVHSRAFQENVGDDGMDWVKEFSSKNLEGSSVLNKSEFKKFVSQITTLPAPSGSEFNDNFLDELYLIVDEKLK